MMEVAFTLDTTGSMSQALDEVKGRVSAMMQRLLADIPGIKMAALAHGDYCDEDVFYLTRLHNLTASLPDLVGFVGGLEGTGGGDTAECYELVLKMARHDLHWTPMSQRILVVIGDAFPHAPGDPENRQGIDWEEQVKELVNMGVKIYGVQVFDDPESSAFFSKMAAATGGQHLKLTQFGHLCDVIMAICYREKGVEFLENFQAEVEDRTDRIATTNPDLQGVFTALRWETSSSGDVSGAIPPTAASASSGESNDFTPSTATAPSSEHSTNTVPDVTSTSTSSDTVSKPALGSSSSFKEHSDVTAAPTSSGAVFKLADCVSMDFSDVTPVSPLPALQRECSAHSNWSDLSFDVRDGIMDAGSNSHRRWKQRPRKAKGKRVSKKVKKALAKTPLLRREKVGQPHFRFRDLPWSPWTLVAVPTPGREEMTSQEGKWRPIRSSGGTASGQIRYDLESERGGRSKLQTRGKTVLLEMGVQTRPGNPRHVVWGRVVSARHRQVSFSRLLTSGRYVRAQLERVLRSGCKVFARMAEVRKKMLPEVRKDLKKMYDYAWCPVLQSRDRGCHRDVVVALGDRYQSSSLRVQIAGLGTV